MSSSQYPLPPPAYQATGSSRKPLIDLAPDAVEPLFGRAQSPGGGIYDQPEQGDIPDDFKVCKYPGAVPCMLTSIIKVRCHRF